MNAVTGNEDTIVTRERVFSLVYVVKDGDRTGFDVVAVVDACRAVLRGSVCEDVE